MTSLHVSERMVWGMHTWTAFFFFFWFVGQIVEGSL